MNVAFDEEFIARLAARADEEAREYADYLTQCRKELVGAARAVDTYMLVGSTALTRDPVRRYNSAYFVTPQGRIAGRYDKIHLVIFGEYTPLADVLPFLKFFRPEVMGPDLTPGKLRRLFDLPVPGGEAKFGVTICYEDSVADLFSKFVADGAEFMVNITNDGWFRNSTELDEHLAVCTFRAVENRVPIARCANTGISALIAPDGRIAQRIVLPDGRYREVEGTLIGNLTMTKLKSFYSARDSQPVVGVHVDLAHAVPDAELNLLDRHAPGGFQLAAVLVDDVLQFFRNARGAVHHQVVSGQPLVDCDQPVHLERFARGLLGEFIGAVAGADGDGQRVHAGLPARTPPPGRGRSGGSARPSPRRGRLRCRPGSRFRLPP